MKPTRVLVPVPAEIGLAYDGRAWKLVAAPPAWWLVEREREHREDSKLPEAEQTHAEQPSDLKIKAEHRPTGW